ncbi:integrase core domain-containing protein [Legionella sp. 27cVA30]|uniref:integrase core domain-containing protein n=1 Tax=Legionella sp. 27cVA30 TaxID=2905657 RepID=UPI003531C539
MVRSIYTKEFKVKAIEFLEQSNKPLRQVARELGVAENMYAFRNLTEVREITEAWIKEYNEERPHQALNSMTPVQYRLNRNPETSSLAWH